MELSSHLLIAGMFLINGIACFVMAKVFEEKKEQLAKILYMGAISSLAMAPTLYFIIKAQS